MIELLEWCGCLVDFLSVAGALLEPRPQKRRDKLRRARALRRNRRIRRWLAKTRGEGPIPRIGLNCPKCTYNFTGLTSRVCPECGTPFKIRDFIDTTVRRRRKRKPPSSPQQNQG